MSTIRKHGKSYLVTSKQAVLNLLGLAQRAGRLVTGTDLVLAKIKQADLLIIAAETSQQSAQRLKQAARAHSVPIIQIFTGLELSQAIGRQRKVMAVTDNGFAQTIMKKINQGV